MYPAQSAAVLIKDLIMVDIPLTQRGAERPEGIAVDLAAGTNDALDNDTHGFGVQFGDLYFEKTGMFLPSKGHRCQRAGFLYFPVSFPVWPGRTEVGVVQPYDAGKDIILVPLPHCLTKTVQ